MTPSRRVVANAVGSVVTGVGGVVVKSKLDDVSEKAAKGAVARLLMDKGIDDCSSADIEQGEGGRSDGRRNDATALLPIRNLHLVATLLAD